MKTIFFVTDALYYQNWISEIIKKYQENQISHLTLSVATYAFILHLTEQSVKTLHLDNKLYHMYMKPVLNYIEHHYDQDFSIEDLSKQAFITPQYLNRLFKKFHQQTTTEYVNQFRIKKAKELLITKKNTEVQVVAQLVGFKSASHFIATFKKYTGYTPMHFREMYLG